MPSVSSGDRGAVVDLDRAAAEAESLFRRTLSDFKRGSTYKQMGVGAAAGLVTGYLGMKVGKMVAMTVGGTLLRAGLQASSSQVMQVAAHKDYVKDNWKKVDGDLQRISEMVQDVHRSATGALGEVRRFAAENKYVAVGFGGGFLVGVSCS